MFLDFQKNEYFLGYEHFVDIIWGHPKIGLVLGVMSMYFRVFSLGKYTDSGYLFGLQNFKYFLGVLQISDIFGG